MQEKEIELLEEIKCIFDYRELNEQNMREARNRVDQILEINPENGEAYYYQLLLDYGMESMDELQDANMTAQEIEELEAVQKILKYGNASSKAEIEEILEQHRNAEAFGMSVQDMAGGAKFMWDLQKHQYEVGDGSTYIGRRFQQEYAGEFRKYLRLQKKMVRTSDYDEKAKKYGIAGLLLTILEAAVLTGMEMPVVIPVTIGVVLLLPGIYFFAGSLQYNKAYQESRALEETYITPFEDKVRKEMEEYCRTKLKGHGNVELKGVKHYCRRWY